MRLNNTAVKIKFKIPEREIRVFYKEYNGLLLPYFIRKFDKPVLETIVSFPFSVDAVFPDIGKIRSIETIPLVKDKFRFDGRKERKQALKPSIKRFQGGDFVAFCDTETGEIITGDRFEKMPLCEKIFVLEHEKGHIFFDSETDADSYALESIVKMGFPIFHGYNCLYNNISNEREQRLKNIEDLILKYGKVN